MLQAEALMNTRPDSALTLLESIADTLAMLPEETRMYHQLLTIQAKDKLYITHTSDSLINRIVAFYEEYGNIDRLMMAYFYQGSTYRDMNDAPRGSIPGSGRSPGEGNGNPLQYSCLENPMDGEAQ